ncbi:hypothetical protein ACFLYP_04070 [Chloroflexota bacterium]
MDFHQLATTITLFIAPFLPYLLSMKDEAVKEIGEKFGEAAWNMARKIWGKLKRAMKDKSELSGAMTILASNPSDEYFQITLVKILTKTLETSVELATELSQIIDNKDIVLSVLVKNESRVKSISQKLGRSGTSKVIVKNKSQVGDINQEAK